MSRTSTRALRPLAWFFGAAALLVTFSPTGVMAEEQDPPGRVARLKYVRGSVSFRPAGDSDWVAATVNRPTTTGDKLWTDPGARAELTLGSATIRLASATGFAFLNLDDRTVQLELTQGTLGVHVRRLAGGETFEVDTPNQAFTITRPGQYRIEADADGLTTLVTVREGEGEATGAGRIYALHAGQSASLTGGDSLRADVGGLRGTDEFDDWGESRDRHDDESPSARYVSRDVVGYEDLDDYGTWRADARYGDVWMPTRVASGWAPYRDGHWAWIFPWGWTWIDDEPWGYAPFHYGRWVSVSDSWGWIPGPIAFQPVYAPALVAFIGGPGFGVSLSVGGGDYNGYVGWFPLGPREVYVPAYHVSHAYVNRVNVSNTTVSSTTVTTVYNNQVSNDYSSTNITYANRAVRGGVTAVPHGTFAGAQPVARSAVVLTPRQLASAPVGVVPSVAPTRASVLATHSTGGEAAHPPAATIARSVVTKVTPPPPQVPFVRQEAALAVHPGRPLAPREVETLRQAGDASRAQPAVRPAPPGKPAVPDTARPAPVSARRPEPAPPAPVAAPVPVATRARPEPARNDRPPAAQAPTPPAARPEPPRNDRPPAAQAPTPPAARPEPPRNDRPPAAQPSSRPPPAAQAQPRPPESRPKQPAVRAERPQQKDPGRRDEEKR